MFYNSLKRALGLTFILLLLALPTIAQQLKGKVVDSGNSATALVGASIVWLGTTQGTTADENGEFVLDFSAAVTPQIIASYIGYKPDTINVKDLQTITIKLKSTGSLKEVVVETNQDRFSAFTPAQSQTITIRDLEKSACCNLAESFETNASVEVTTTDAVSGAKQIQMLGLDGAYTLLTTDNIPALQGLATPYRLNYLSGTYIESIDIIKGMGSVLNGYESISGQVNVKLRDPEKAEQLYLNLYGNSLAKFDANLNVGVQLNPKWSTILMLHSNHLGNRVDRNKDGFMDQSLGTQFNVYNKWKYIYEDVVSEFGINALRETRLGGQVDYQKGESAGQFFGTESETDRISAFNKSSYTFKGKPYQSIGFIASGSHHKFDSMYGRRNYSGEQNSANARLIFQSIIGNTGHTYKAGLSYTYDGFQEQLESTSFARTEQVPGIFGEYIFNNASNLTIVTGARLDFHNLYGTIFTPRFNLKFDATPNTIFRLAAGKGFRVANPIAENTAALVSSRQFVFSENLEPEKAWNAGGSFTHYFEIGNRPGAFVTDYYYTSFQNQVVADMYTHADQIMFYNLQGRSYSNSFQTEVQYELLKGLDLKAAYKFYDVKATYNGKLIQMPMVPQHRFFVNMGFATPFDKWRADITTQYFGEMPLASHESFSGVTGTRTSKPFYTVNSQVTRAFKRWEVYLGGENLLNFRQKDPIIGAANPFGPEFDASMVWGPVTGRVIYAGLRFRIN